MQSCQGSPEIQNCDRQLISRPVHEQELNVIAWMILVVPESMHTQSDQIAMHDCLKFWF